MSSFKRSWPFEGRNDAQGPSGNSSQQQAPGTSNRLLAPLTSSAATLNATLADQELNIGVPRQSMLRSSTNEATSAPAIPSKAFRSAGRLGWTGLNGLLEVLGKSAGVYAPLKEIVGELVGLIDVYEVRA